MKLNTEQFDKWLHEIPMLIQHLKDIENEILEIRQGFIKAIEEEDEISKT